MSYNVLGFVVFIAGFGAAYGILQLFGSSDEGPWMMIAGPLIAIVDVGYRRIKRLKLLGDISRGPEILFLPAWVWGVFWFALGTYYYLR